MLMDGRTTDGHQAHRYIPETFGRGINMAEHGIHCLPCFYTNDVIYLLVNLPRYKAQQLLFYSCYDSWARLFKTKFIVS